MAKKEKKKICRSTPEMREKGVMIIVLAIMFGYVYWIWFY